MQLLNLKYTDEYALESFIHKEAMKNFSSVFIQLFFSGQKSEDLYKIRDIIISLLPNATILATSTAGIVADSGIEDGEVFLSFSLFSDSKVCVKCYKDTDLTSIIHSLSSEFITSQTKLLVVFANTYSCDSEKLLSKIAKKYPSLSISGGNSGDDFRFEGGLVFTHNCDNCDVAFAAINSDVLEVETKYLFNWQPIGREMRVSKSRGNKVYEINGENILDLYEKYLGSDISNNMLTYGIEFPLITEQDGIQVARAAVDVDKKREWVKFTGEIKEGSFVRFAYANIDNIERENRALLEEDTQYNHEALYIYTCAARRQVLGNYLNTEVASLQEVAPVSGFVSYGEFFHNRENKTNNLLNISTSYVLLNEKQKQKKASVKKGTIQEKKEDIRLKALTTLVTKTSQELEESVHYLEQFKKSVEEASIFSITDEKGIITDVNENFEHISGYKKEELIGQSHNIVRHEDTPKELFKDMWKTIQSKKIWKGMVKNKRKDGHPYYVISEISPIFNKDGSFKEYIGIRNDVTELEEYKNILRHELNSTSENLEDNLYYTSQYEDAINSITAVIKTDTSNMITYANKKFCELSGYALDELIGKNCSDLRHQKHRDSKLCEKIAQRLSQRFTANHILTNIAKDGSEYITNTLFYPMLHRDGSVMEYLQIMHDVTEISVLNEEIINTQKEVVLTMGAIGETRSQETGLHVKRVAEYSYLLAKLVGLSENEASLLKQASPMHDIGKVGIPDSILNKPGKLTSEEFEVMKSHAMIGYEMLKHSKRPILKASAQVALTHHEKYDGSGYPQGLRAEDIPIYGRITAIADVFDALGHDRCYKKAWELERILELFREESGKHFDPNLIDLFFENLDKFLTIRDNFQD